MKVWLQVKKMVQSRILAQNTDGDIGQTMVSHSDMRFSRKIQTIEKQVHKVNRGHSTDIPLEFS